MDMDIFYIQNKPQKNRRIKLPELGLTIIHGMALPAHHVEYVVRQLRGIEDAIEDAIVGGAVAAVVL